MTKKVAFLGLGVMGYPMAGHLAKAGHDVTVYNRTAAKAAQWVAQHGGHGKAAAATPAEAARGADLVLMCVGNDDDVRAVGAAALAGMSPGALLVDHTTASAEVAREMHASAATRGVAFLDAPVSGGQAGAESGKLTVMVGGDAAAFAAAEPVLAHYAKAVTLMGGPGAGQLTKMVNQICIAGLVQGAVRGDRLRRPRRASTSSGCSTSSARARRSRGRWRTAAARWSRTSSISGSRSTGCARTWASASPRRARNGSALPVTALVDQFYARVQAKGGGRWDTSSLVRLLRDPQ